MRRDESVWEWVSRWILERELNISPCFGPRDGAEALGRWADDGGPV